MQMACPDTNGRRIRKVCGMTASHEGLLPWRAASVQACRLAGLGRLLVCDVERVLMLRQQSTFKAQ